VAEKHSAARRRRGDRARSPGAPRAALPRTGAGAVGPPAPAAGRCGARSRPARRGGRARVLPAASLGGRPVTVAVARRLLPPRPPRVAGRAWPAAGLGGPPPSVTNGRWRSVAHAAVCGSAPESDSAACDGVCRQRYSKKEKQTAEAITVVPKRRSASAPPSALPTHHCRAGVGVTPHPLRPRSAAVTALPARPHRLIRPARAHAGAVAAREHAAAAHVRRVAVGAEPDPLGANPMVAKGAAATLGVASPTRAAGGHPLDAPLHVALGAVVLAAAPVAAAPAQAVAVRTTVGGATARRAAARRAAARGAAAR